MNELEHGTINLRSIMVNEKDKLQENISIIDLYKGLNHTEQMW